MRFVTTEDGSYPVLTADEKKAVKKVKALFDRIARRLAELDTANDDMEARAGMVVSDIEEFDDAVENAREGF